jgi:hypothetical protein
MGERIDWGVRFIMVVRMSTRESKVCAQERRAATVVFEWLLKGWILRCSKMLRVGGLKSDEEVRWRN